MKKSLSIRKSLSRGSLMPEEELVEETIEEEKIQIDKKKMFEMISDHKCDLILGLSGAFLYGAGSPFTGLAMGYSINALSFRDPDKVKKRFILGFISFISSLLCILIYFFFKNWKLESLGSLMTSRIRKRIFQKYLEFYMDYYDIDANSPGALLTNLSIDTTQFSSFFYLFLEEYLVLQEQ